MWNKNDCVFFMAWDLGWILVSPGKYMYIFEGGEMHEILPIEFSSGDEREHWLAAAVSHSFRVISFILVTFTDKRKTKYNTQTHSHRYGYGISI